MFTKGGITSGRHKYTERPLERAQCYSDTGTGRSLYDHTRAVLALNMNLTLSLASTIFKRSAFSEFWTSLDHMQSTDMYIQVQIPFLTEMGVGVGKKGG